eukprot:UN07053
MTSEEINCLIVKEDKYLWISTDYIYAMYENDKEKIYKMFSDKIIDMKIGTLPGVNVGIIACADHSIQILMPRKDEKGNVTIDVLHKFSVKFCPSVLCIFPQKDKNVVNFIYGDKEGHIGFVHVDKDVIRQNWVVDLDDVDTSEVSAISAYDITSDGKVDIIVGTSDGNVYVLARDSGNPVRIANCDEVGEEITNISLGYVSELTSVDIVVTTYSGTIHLIHWMDKEGFEINTSSPKTYTKQNSCEKHKLAQEKNQLLKHISNLKVEVVKLKKKYNKSSGDMIAVVSESFSGKAEYSLKSEHDFNELIVDMSENIDLITIQSTVPLMILPMDNQKYHFTKFDNKDNCFLASLQPVNQSKRIKIPIRSEEGKTGVMNVIVTSRQSTRIARSFQINIKSLALHNRLFTQINEQSIPCHSSMTIEGNFTKQLIGSWLSHCLVDIPRSTSTTSDNYVYTWKSSFTGLTVYCTWKNNQCVVWSDNVSILMVIKNTVVNLATEHTITISTKTDINATSIQQCMSILIPKLKSAKDIQHRHKLLSALKEIELQEGNTEFLSEE